jgi:tRNA U34 2-thiouridine synthase MnmA/TrmU
MLRCLCQIRYRQSPALCTVSFLAEPNDSFGKRSESQMRIIRVSFAEPQRAIAPGQMSVFYDLQGEQCIGGGSILATGPNYHLQAKTLPNIPS